MNERRKAEPAKAGKSEVAPEIWGHVVRIMRAAAKAQESNRDVWSYFTKFQRASILSQRATKDTLPARLRAAEERPQIVTVQGRGGRKGNSYLIIPLEKAADALEVAKEEREFVPITEMLKRIGEEVDLTGFEVKPTGWRRRQRRIDIAEPQIRIDEV